MNYTAVVVATEPAPKGNSPLVLLLKNLCNSTHLSKVCQNISCKNIRLTYALHGVTSGDVLEEGL